MDEMNVMSFLCEQIGVTTLSDLEDFEKETLKFEGDIMKRLAFYYAFGYKFKGVKNDKRVHNQAEVAEFERGHRYKPHKSVHGF
jgi:hypothetical protein